MKPPVCIWCFGSGLRTFREVQVDCCDESMSATAICSQKLHSMLSVLLVDQLQVHANYRCSATVVPLQASGTNSEAAAS